MIGADVALNGLAPTSDSDVLYWLGAAIAVRDPGPSPFLFEPLTVRFKDPGILGLR
jgi:hypothetical protein